MAGKLVSRPLLFIITSACNKEPLDSQIRQCVIANFLDEDEITGAYIFNPFTISSVLYKFRKGCKRSRDH